MCFGTGDESSINSTLENASAVFHRHNAPIENYSGPRALVGPIFFAPPAFDGRLRAKPPLRPA
eukprot:scaffold142389_cov148-Phaeocystis_antarctica.AAC.1